MSVWSVYFDKKEIHRCICSTYSWNLWGMDTIREDDCQNCFVSHLKGVYSKRKEFAPMGSKFFPFEVDPFVEEAYVQEIFKVFSLLKYDGKLPGVSSPHIFLYPSASFKSFLQYTAVFTSYLCDSVHLRARTNCGMERVGKEEKSRKNG